MTSTKQQRKARLPLRILLGVVTGIAATAVTTLLALSLSYNLGATSFEISVNPTGTDDWSTLIKVEASKTASALLVTGVSGLLVGSIAGILAGRWILDRGAKQFAAISITAGFAETVFFLCVDIDDSALLETSRRFRTRHLGHIDRDRLYIGFRVTPGAKTSELGSIIGRDTDPIGDDKWIVENAESIQKRWEECADASEWMKYISSLQPYRSQCTDIGSPIVDFEVARSVSKACVRHALLLIARGETEGGIGELSDVARFGQTLQRGGGFLVDVMIGVVVEKLAFENLLRVAESGVLRGHWPELDRALNWSDAQRDQAVLEAFHSESAIMTGVFEKWDRQSRDIFYPAIRLVWNPGATMQRFSDLMTQTANAIVANNELEMERLSTLGVPEGLPSHLAFKNMIGALTAESAIPPGSKKVAASLKGLKEFHLTLAKLRAEAMPNSAHPLD